MTQTSLNQPKPTVTNAEVEAYLSMQETRKSLKARLELMEQAVDKAEGEILAKIELGADMSNCGYAVSVTRSERRFPAWKEHFISKLGKTEADAVLESTPAKLYKSLKIE